MNFKDMLDKLSMLSEATKETEKGRIHKAEPGGYGRKFDTDEEGEEKDGEKDAKKPAEKRGRGRPTKTGAHVSSPAEKKKQQEKEKASKDLQSFIVGNVPKKSKELEKLPKKKHSLKEFFEQIDEERVLKEAEQVTIEPAKQNTQVIRQGTKTLGTVTNPQLAQQIKQSIGKGEMSLAGDKLGEEAVSEKWAGDAKIKATGEYAKKSVEELKSMLAKLKKSGPHAEDSPEAKKQRQINFALRSKGGWKKGEGAAMKEGQLSEVEQPTMDNMSAMGAGLGAGRSDKALEEAKKTVKKDDKAEKAGKKVAKDIEYDEKVKDKIHGKKRHAEDEKAEKAGKKVAKDIEYDEKKDKKKKTMKEGMSHKLAAARLEGKSHGLRGHAHNGKHYEDMEEARAYHEGYKEGLDECYGMMPIRGVVVGEDPMPATVPGMASAAMPAMEAPLFPRLRTDGVTKKASAWLNDPKLQTQVQALKGTGYLAPNDPSKGLRQDPQAPRDMQDPVDFELTNPMYFAAYLTRVIKKLGDINITGIVEPGMTMEDEMEEGNLFTGNLAKARAAGKKFADLDSDGDMEKVTEFAFEAWDKELNSLLTESEEVNEGMTVSISKGQQGAPDSVSVSAQDAEAEKLLSFIKQAGLGIFADDAKSDYGSPELAKHAHGDIEVVDDHDGMMSLMKKMTDTGDSDYKDEEHHSDHDHDEETCNECGYMESSCKCDEEMVEDKSYDQEEYEVAESDELEELKRLAGHNVAQPADDSKMGMQEDNPPDSGAHNTEEEIADTAQANNNATDREETFGTTMEDGSEASEEPVQPITDEEIEEGLGDNLKKAAAAGILGLGLAAGGMGSAKAAPDQMKPAAVQTVKQDQFKGAPTLVAGKHFSIPAGSGERMMAFFGSGAKSHKYELKQISSLDQAPAPGPRAKYVFLKMPDQGFGGKTVKAYAPDEMGTQLFLLSSTNESKLDEWANDAGKRGTETTFVTNDEFMLDTISSGLNKKKVTGQTTIPVIAGQDNRMGNDDLVSWKKLAGLK